MVKENVDYELIPVDGPNDQAWEVRILTGDYVETVIRFGSIRFDEVDEHIHFDFFVSYSPDSSLNEGDEGLQQQAAAILSDVLETAVEEKTLLTEPRNDS
jgi:hypothetical protein